MNSLATMRRSSAFTPSRCVALLLSLAVHGFVLHYWLTKVALDAHGNVKPLKGACFSSEAFKEHLCVFAAGQFAQGIFVVGQLAVGVFTLGQCGIGLLFFLGQGGAGVGYIPLCQGGSATWIGGGQICLALYRCKCAQVGVSVLAGVFNPGESLCVAVNCEASDADNDQSDNSDGGVAMESSSMTATPFGQFQIFIRVGAQTPFPLAVSKTDTIGDIKLQLSLRGYGESMRLEFRGEELRESGVTVYAHGIVEGSLLLAADPSVPLAFATTSSAPESAPPMCIYCGEVAASLRCTNYAGKHCITCCTMRFPCPPCRDDLKLQTR